MSKTLRLILGDQLNHKHSWFKKTNKDVLFVMMEMKQETAYVKHHIQKVIAFFLAMRNFAEEKQAEGHQFIYWKLDEKENEQDLAKNIGKLIEEKGIEQFEYQFPDEYRLDQQLLKLSEDLPIPTKAYDTEHFLTERDFVAQFFKGKKTYLMESFYRQMRKEYDILMESEKKPVGEKWNYDASNRNKYKGEVPIPKELTFKKDVSEIVNLLQEMEVETIGNVDAENFEWATSRGEGLQVLDYFKNNLLPHFGDYQDAMTESEAYLFHSRLSFLMNSKLLSPFEVVKACEEHWEANQDKIGLSQIEGFIRQIIGWREYMRGIYWAKMPEFAERNFFNHTRKLPNFYWTGKTKMNCLSDSISKSLDNSYAHHIQRLMITGNFALLAGINPDEVDAWYLGIYIDAIEWVEITNTRGMSQFADGGIVGTKPYVSSANYIHKMSSYCSNCSYDKKKKHGENACPFNSLYWHFYERNREKLEKNPRIGMAYRTLDKMDKDKLEEILNQAEEYLENINSL